MKKYDKGAVFERGVKKKLEDEGWFVIRSAGSKSKVDLVAIKRDSAPLLVQCRLDGRLSELERGSEENSPKIRRRSDASAEGGKKA